MSRSLDSLNSFGKIKPSKLSKPSRPFELFKTVETVRIGLIDKNSGVDLGRVFPTKGFKKRSLSIEFGLVVVLLSIDKRAYRLEFLIYLDG